MDTHLQQKEEAMPSMFRRVLAQKVRTRAPDLEQRNLLEDPFSYDSSSLCDEHKLPSVEGFENFVCSQTFSASSDCVQQTSVPSVPTEISSCTVCFLSNLFYMCARCMYDFSFLFFFFFFFGHECHICVYLVCSFVINADGTIENL